MTRGNLNNCRNTKKAGAPPVPEPSRDLRRSLLNLLVGGPVDSSDQALRILLLRDRPGGGNGRGRR